MGNRTLIMKFGGASLATPSHFLQLATCIEKHLEMCNRLVIVVSAMGEMTSELMKLSREISSRPLKREQDMLISVGERISMALLAMALSDKGIEAISLTGSQSGIVTSNRHLEASIIAVRPTRLVHHLNEGKVVIVAGFQGVSKVKEITTLGRGGSDTTAVALGVALGAKVVKFYKDVLGFHREDPKKHPNAPLFSNLTFQEALFLANKGSSPLHIRSILLASKNGLPLHVLSFREEEGELFPGTVIGGSQAIENPERFYEDDNEERG